MNWKLIRNGMFNVSCLWSIAGVFWYMFPWKSILRAKSSLVSCFGKALDGKTLSRKKKKDVEWCCHVQLVANSLSPFVHC